RDIIAQVAPVRRIKMVDVDGVFHEQLPVRAHGIFVGARQDRVPAFVLVEDHVEIGTRAGEIVLQALLIAAEADEEPAAIILHARRVETHLLYLEAWSVGILEWDAVQSALIVVAPAVVEAHEALGVAARVAANRRAAVATAVVKDADLAV